MKRRTIYLIRHGQYTPEEGQDTKPPGTGLTETGVQQAEMTADFLADIPFTKLCASTMLRAKQTAKIIQSRFPHLRLKTSKRLCEIIPPVPYLAMKYVKEISHERIARDRHQAERAYAAYFKPAGNKNEVEVIVSHGNLIRYFTCRVLQISPLVWMNFETYNCSITTVELDENGNAILLSYNESGHLSEKLRTQNLTPMGVKSKE